MKIDEFIPINGWEIKTFDFETSSIVWKKIKHIVRKNNSRGVVVSSSDKKTQIVVSPEHRFFVRFNETTMTWVEAIELLAYNNVFDLFSEEKTWIPCSVEMLEEEIEIVDIEVEDTGCYFSNGFLSHNTMYGDPTTTPGGVAIPFHASVRIKLGSGAHIKQNGDKGDVVGIEVTAKTIKNKIAPPFRTCGFQIHFGVGIKEHEQIFDMLRENGEEVINGKSLCVSGDGAWKLLSVKDVTTNKTLVEKKFYKSEFGKVIEDPACASYIDDLIEVAMVKKFANAGPDIDAESYTDVKALADEVEQDVLNDLST